jgi:uncharacterized protein with von Willebrand factor type A (vWA) domain
LPPVCTADPHVASPHHRPTEPHLSCWRALKLQPASDLAKAATEPCKAALDMGLVHLEREEARRERDAHRPPLIDLRYTTVTSAKFGQDGD